MWRGLIHPTKATAGCIANQRVLRAYAGYAATPLPHRHRMNNHRPHHRQADPGRAMAGEGLRREELLVDHHSEELLDAIDSLVDPSTPGTPRPS